MSVKACTSLQRQLELECAIAAYEQKLMDSMLKVADDNEFTIYRAPAGKMD